MYLPFKTTHTPTERGLASLLWDSVPDSSLDVLWPQVQRASARPKWLQGPGHIETITELYAKDIRHSEMSGQNSHIENRFSFTGADTCNDLARLIRLSQLLAELPASFLSYGGLFGLAQPVLGSHTGTQAALRPAKPCLLLLQALQLI